MNSFRFRALLTLLLLTGAAIAQDGSFPPDTIAPAPSSSRFLGTWEGQLHGETWITVRLVETGGTITGTVIRNRALFDRNGQISKIETEKVKGRVIDAKPDRDVLSFQVQNNDSGAREPFEMTLRGDSAAEIRKLRAPLHNGVTVKPWKLKKTGSE